MTAYEECKVFEGKTAIITGGSSGIGEATAWHLARGGAKVALLSRGEEDIKEVASQLRAAGFTAMPFSADISNYDSMVNVAEQVMDEWGHIDYLFANAGINGVWAPIEELDVAEWNKTIDVNINGTYYTIKAVYPHMKDRGGSIVVTASINGTRTFSNTGATAYASTKAAQVAMTKMLAIEFAPHQVRINVVCPGSIDTEIEESTDRQDLEEARMGVQYPKGKIPLTGKDPGTSAEVAQVVGFLFSDAASHVTGTEMWIDGGQSLLMG